MVGPVHIVSAQTAIQAPYVKRSILSLSTFVSFWNVGKRHVLWSYGQQCVVVMDDE